MKKTMKNMMIGGLTAGFSQAVLSGVKNGMTPGSPESDTIGNIQGGISNITSSFPLMGSISGANMTMKAVKKLYKK